MREALAKPTVRAESVLDGIFAQAVVVLEADTDRTVYQAVWEALQDEVRRDIHFAAVGGTGGIADTCQLYRTLRIPVAVVADLDLIVDTAKLRRILTVLSTPERTLELFEKAAALAERIRALPPEIAPADVRQQLTSILELQMDWRNGDDATVRGRLSETGNALDRMRRLKRGGVASLPNDIGRLAGEVLTELQGAGLFLVPVGELEEWLKDEVTVSKANKWAWANEAAAKARSIEPRESDVWAFMRGVGAYLTAST
ncbi:MAG: hypothetical protein Q8K82_24815 [Gemmatimonadaceae bacterium]|nr:hypothetical protein [Gemmatimonadaceae bacterium]